MTNQLFESLRQTEFSRLDAENHAYLDYTGSGLYGQSQIEAHMQILQTQVMGNPHSQNPTSLLATEYVETARQRILQFFNADPDEYEVIFTSNASGALKLVGESYPFMPGSRYVLLADNHNSVNGIREFAQSHRAQVKYIPLNDALCVDDIEPYLKSPDTGKPNLFAFPAQSNFSGVKHPLEWIEVAKSHGYDVLLDAAAYAPTNRLDLRIVKPHFVTISFYKMFGYPTGIGALIAERRILHKLQRPWFAGGTVRFVSAQNQVHHLHLTGEAFEDGTLNFLSIAAVPIGLDFLDQVGMDTLNEHVMTLTQMLLDGLLPLRHSNGQAMIDLYGIPTTANRGGTVTFNIITPGGATVDSAVVEAKANKAKISLRTGCFCNPGASETAFHYGAVEAYECFEDITYEEFTIQQFATCMNDMPAGAVRVSVGIASNESDVRRLIQFVESFRDMEPQPTAKTLPSSVNSSA